jgi:uncharacterized membrane protein
VFIFFCALIIDWIFPDNEVCRIPYYHMYPYMGFWTGLVWLIVIIVIAYLIYRLIKSEKILAPNRPLIRSAEDILAERYAKES